VHRPGLTYWTQLDGLRAVAFLLVMFHHHWAPAKLFPLDFMQQALVKVAEWGWLGVDLFFVLSAFLVTHLLCAELSVKQDISLGKFYLRRALRIWPLFFLVLTAVCFAYPLFAPHKASHLYRLFLEQIALPLYTFSGNFGLALHFNAMQDYAQASGLDFMAFVTLLCPFWSLCIEEQFYLFWGLTVKAARNIRTIAFITGALIAVGFLARFWLLSNRGTDASTCYYMHSLWHLDTIMLGAFLAILLNRRPQIFDCLRSGWLPATLTASVIAIFLAIVNLAPGIHSGSYWLAPIMTLISLIGALSVALVLHWTPLAKLMSSKIIASIGKLTFGMYVFHYAVIWYARTWLHLDMKGINGVTSFVVSFALTYAVAQISWRVLEKPMNSLRRKFSQVEYVLVSASGSEQIPAPSPIAAEPEPRPMAVR
jgi:peptidoglycan/LPS O-acetylase OafA/YrhL